MSKFICDCHNQEFKTENALYRHSRRFKNPEKFRSYDKKYSATHRDERKEYREKTKERDLSYHSTYYKDNKKEHNLRVKRYKKTPKGRLVSKLNTLNRRKYVEESSKLTKETVENLLSYYYLTYGKLICILCFKEILKGEEELEHIIPLSRNRDFPGLDLNSLPNLGFAHRSCNSSKYDKTLEEWFQLNPLYLVEGLNKGIVRKGKLYA